MFSFPSTDIEDNLRLSDAKMMADAKVMGDRKDLSLPISFSGLQYIHTL